MATEAPFQTHALLYVARKFLVIPLRPGSKEPATKNGSKDASNDPAQIKAWMQEFPLANIGIVGGKKSGITGTCIVDVDKQHNGFETMMRLAKMKGEIPDGPRAQTPSGGVHLYFAFEDKIVQGANKLGQGVDVKSTNGYVVAPPSRWDGVRRGETVLPGGGAYKWLRAPLGSNLPRMPQWMVSMLIPKATNFTPKAVDYSNPTNEQVMILLSHIPNDDYQIWIKVGMGLKAAMGDAGFPLWDTWSSNGYANYDSRETNRHWQSFRKNHGISMASIVWEAKQHGAPVANILKNGEIATS